MKIYKFCNFNEINPPSHFFIDSIFLLCYHHERIRKGTRQCEGDGMIIR